MSKQENFIVILMAEDDPDDQLLIEEALAETQMAGELLFVEDGEELMDFLHRRGQYTDLARSPRPSLILLDLNMPRKDGRKALEEIKADPNLRRIPIVVLTTSKTKEDILQTYDLGANSFITKPIAFESLVHAMKTLTQYWSETVTLPPGESRD
jgi:CheY-like chemotaxis protein